MSEMLSIIVLKISTTMLLLECWIEFFSSLFMALVLSLCMFVCLKIFERILFIWAIRHPASGYVQGINDLVTPFFVVFVFEYIGEWQTPPPLFFFNFHFKTP